MEAGSSALPDLGGRRPADLASAPEPPTIELTIGRIEVKAPPPPRPPPAAPPASRLAMSLSDYLQRRSEADR
jgi:hypothetical protein